MEAGKTILYAEEKRFQPFKQCNKATIPIWRTIHAANNIINIL